MPALLPSTARNHTRALNGGMRGVGGQERLNEHDELGRNAAPAGGLSVSPNDMARWLLIQLDGGKLPGQTGRLFSAAAHEADVTPLVLEPIEERPESLKPIQPCSARTRSAGMLRTIGERKSCGTAVRCLDSSRPSS